MLCSRFASGHLELEVGGFILAICREVLFPLLINSPFFILSGTILIIVFSQLIREYKKLKPSNMEDLEYKIKLILGFVFWIVLILIIKVGTWFI